MRFGEIKCHEINSQYQLKTRAKDVLPNIHRTQAHAVTPGGDAVVPSAAAAGCLQQSYTIRVRPGGDGSAFLSMVT